MTYTSKEALKPCPFCGGEGEFQTFGIDNWVECRGCMALNAVGSVGPEQAAAAWNTRAAPVVSREQFEAAKKTWARGYWPDDCPSTTEHLEEIIRLLDLAIIDSEPGRECGCPQVQSHGRGNVWWFACEKSDRALVATRCTLKDGETDQ